MNGRLTIVIAAAAALLSAFTAVAMRRASGKSVTPWHMPRWTGRVAGRAGRRGAFLAFLTILDVSYGWALATASVLALGHSPDLFLPVHTWGWIWFGTGIFCATGVLMRRDWAQYWAASVLKGCWAGVYADIWLVQHGAQAWISVIVWLSFSLTVLLVGGWPEYVALPEAPVLPSEDQLSGTAEE